MSGQWQTIRQPHRLVQIGKRMIDRGPDQDIRVWPMAVVAGGGDPLPGAVTWQGDWSWLDDADELIALDDTRVLSWTPSTGAFALRLLTLGTSFTEIGDDPTVLYLTPNANLWTVMHELGHTRSACVTSTSARIARRITCTSNGTTSCPSAAGTSRPTRPTT